MVPILIFYKTGVHDNCGVVKRTFLGTNRIEVASRETTCESTV